MSNAKRLGALRKSLRGLDALLISNVLNVRYLTGFTGSSGAALLSRRNAYFLTDFRYREQSLVEVQAPWETVIYKGTLLGTVKSLLRKSGIRKLGFESSISYAQYESLRSFDMGLSPLKGTVEKLRAVKDAEEVLCIREAVARAEAAFLDIKPYIRAGISERSIALRLEERLKRRGCRTIPFDIIVASGGNSAMPHAKATQRKLAPGDLVIIDWGGEAQGYVSDMTRTLIVKGPGIERKREIYRLVLRANRRATAEAASGKGTRSIDNAARDVIKKAGYGDFFGHGLGHGVGMEVHEAPSISWRKNVKVKAGMVFTIEPGIYIPGLGGVRIEDMVLAGSNGRARELTSLSRRLEIIS